MASDLRRALTRSTPSFVSMLLSVVLHSCVAVPYAILNWPDPSAIGEDVPDGPLGDGQVGEGDNPSDPGQSAGMEGGAPELIRPIGPVLVGIYTPPETPELLEGPADPDTPETPEEPDTPEPPPDTPPDTPAPPSDTPPRTGNPDPSSPSGEGTPSPGEEGTGDGAGESGGEGAGDGSGESGGDGVAGQPNPNGTRRPCDPVTEVAQVGSTVWNVERSIIDYYASHLRQLDRQAGTATAHGRGGVPIGVRVYLPRCSVLRSVGLRNKDVILSINDHPVATLPQAIKTWLALRNERDIVVRIRRKNVGQITHTYRIIH